MWKMIDIYTGSNKTINSGLVETYGIFQNENSEVRLRGFHEGLPKEKKILDEIESNFLREHCRAFQIIEDGKIYYKWG